MVVASSGAKDSGVRVYCGNLMGMLTVNGVVLSDSKRGQQGSLPLASGRFQCAKGIISELSFLARREMWGNKHTRALCLAIPMGHNKANDVGGARRNSGNRDIYCASSGRKDKGG